MSNTEVITEDAKPDTEETGKQAVLDHLGERVDLLGASVTRIKMSQEIEDQEAVEELEARYMALRNDFEHAREALSETAATHKGSVFDDLQRRMDEMRRGVSQQLASMETRVRNYMDDADTQKTFKGGRERFQAQLQDIGERVGGAVSSLSNKVPRKRDDQSANKDPERTQTDRD